MVAYVLRRPAHPGALGVQFLNGGQSRLVGRLTLGRGLHLGIAQLRIAAQRRQPFEMLLGPWSGLAQRGFAAVPEVHLKTDGQPLTELRLPSGPCQGVAIERRPLLRSAARRRSPRDHALDAVPGHVVEPALF